MHSERTTKQLIRLLIHEEYETKQTHRLLHAAFERLESETRRVNEAEERVVEIARRFNTVNETRVQAQAEAVKLSAELGMYKLQLNNAQEEIFKAQHILRKVEDERDDAAAEATEARDTARRYREQHLVHLAREEGRKMGYLQGIRHAQMGYIGTKTIEFPDRYTSDAISNRRLLMDEPFDDALENVFDDEQSITDDGVSTVPSRHLYTSRNAARDVELTSNAPRQSQAASHHLNLGSELTWTGRSPTDDAFPRPIHNGFPAPHPETPIPPDGWVPRSEDGSHIAIPPPHEFERTARATSSSSGRSWTTASGIQNRLDRVFGSRLTRKQQSDTPNVAAPVPGYPPNSPTPPSPLSTTFSQFDITATEPDLSDARRKLSVIQEGSVEATPSISVGRSRADARTPALETDHGSPTTNFTIRSPQGEEEPVALMDVIKSHPHKGGPGGGDNRSMHNVQRLSDDLRYSDPNLVENWRRSMVDAAPVCFLPLSGSTFLFNLPEVQNTYSPRRRPPNLTVSAPLSPSRGLASPNLPRNSAGSSNIGIEVEPPVPFPMGHTSSMNCLRSARPILMFMAVSRDIPLLLIC